MIKPINQIVKQIHASAQKDWVGNLPENILKNWADSIVDECAGNFECTMEDDDGYEGIESVGGKHPVIVRGSILNVKNQIK